MGGDNKLYFTLVPFFFNGRATSDSFRDQSLPRPSQTISSTDTTKIQLLIGPHKKCYPHLIVDNFIWNCHSVITEGGMLIRC